MPDTLSSVIKSMKHAHGEDFQKYMRRISLIRCRLIALPDKAEKAVTVGDAERWVNKIKATESAASAIVLLRGIIEKALLAVNLERIKAEARLDEQKNHNCVTPRAWRERIDALEAQAKPEGK